MEINLSKKLKKTMLELDISQIELAKRTNQTQSNLSQKFITNNFKLSEYEKLVTAMGCQLEINIILPNGERV